MTILLPLIIGAAIRHFADLAATKSFPAVKGLAERYAELAAWAGQACLARGAGRAYGDAAVSAEGATLLMTRLNRFIAFDADTGLLRAEAGVTLDDILRAVMPQGWFLPVTPGTRHVTLGGAIAADVHGKNHHGAGSFCAHVDWLDLAIGEGRVRHRLAGEVLGQDLGGDIALAQSGEQQGEFVSRGAGQHQEAFPGEYNCSAVGALKADA
mgnify:CR=1 FL=1